MTATITDTQACDIIAAAILTGARPDVRAEIIESLTHEERRTAYATANRAPRRTAPSHLEHLGDIVVAPCDRGGVRIEYPALGMVLDTEGCWISAEDIDLASIAGEDATTWSHRGLAVAAALATL